ncbi:MAG: ATP-binding protein, partial [Zoogloea sp.]|uniref:ATP-binding protein n=1 Tax=Zoogloea sp. TaxID=49181 RepID=UPI003F37B91C
LEEQGRRLQRIEEQEQFASQSLEFMYRASHYLTENALGSTTLELLIDDLTQTLGAKSCTLTLITAAAEALGPSARPSERLLLLPGDEQALPAGPARLVTSADGSLSRFTVCVQDALDSYGQLSVEIRGGLRFESRQTRLVEATASLLALSLGNLLRDQRRRRLAVMDERNAIAGELHDSLAQALAYMKIQVARLQKELDHSCHQCGTKENKKINEVSSEIKTGLDSAYRHLRELLTAFRTDMPPGGLRRALQEVVTELDARAATNITLDYPTDPPELANHEEFHVLQIVREALTNVVRHARAQQARVSLESLPDGQLQARIEDDGRGALDDLSKEGHYGVSIMKDRARQLGGTLTVEAVQADGKGTRITLNFTPRSRLP